MEGSLGGYGHCDNCERLRDELGQVKDKLAGWISKHEIERTRAEQAERALAGSGELYLKDRAEFVKVVNDLTIANKEKDEYKKALELACDEANNFPDRKIPYGDFDPAYFLAQAKREVEG